MRRKINISLLFASISFVFTLVIANVNWEFSDYKYSSSFLSVTAVAKEPAGQIIVAKKEDNQRDRKDNDENDTEELDSNSFHPDPRNPYTDGIEIISPKSNIPVNSPTPQISWKTVEGITNYSVTIKYIGGSKKRFIDRLTNQSGEVINYQVKQDLTPGRYQLTVEATTESKKKPKPGKVIFEVLKTTADEKKMQN